jgi:hypothetical protein
LLKIEIWGIISATILLTLTIIPQPSVGQIPTLDKLNLESNEAPQCLDFNQDKICEYIVLINGTTVKNPDATGSQSLSSFLAGTDVNAQPQMQGKCLGLGYNYCKNLLLADGSVVPNPNFVDSYVPSGPYGGSTDQTPQVQAQTVEDEAGSGDDDDDNDIKYCDGQAAPAYPDSCYDRNDREDDDDNDGDANNNGQDDDEEVFGEITEGTEEDDGYIDENEDGNYDEGEE